MKYKKIEVKTKDNLPLFVFENREFTVEDNMVIVDDTNTSVICFPMENVLYYRFEMY